MMDRTEQQISAELIHLRALQLGDPALAARPLVQCSPKYVVDLAIEAISRIQLALGIDLEKFKTEADDEVPGKPIGWAESVIEEHGGEVIR